MDENLMNLMDQYTVTSLPAQRSETTVQPELTLDERRELLRTQDQQRFDTIGLPVLGWA